MPTPFPVSNIVDTFMRTTTLSAAQSAIGSIPVYNPGVAYIQTNGNNGTAELGNPAKPYLTAQVAFDAGAVSFHLGVGVTTSITHTFSTVTPVGRFDYLKITGEGSNTSQITLNFNVSGPQGATRLLDLCSDHSATIVSLNSVLSAGTNIQVDGRGLTITTYNLPSGNWGNLFFCKIQNDDIHLNARRSANYCHIAGVNWLNPYDP